MALLCAFAFSLLPGVVAEMEQEKISLTIYQASWTASLFNAQVAKIIVDENFPNIKASLVASSTGRTTIEEMMDQPNILAVMLEAWPSAIADILPFALSSGALEVIGELGVVGQVGWFVPDYVIEEFPDAASWEFYKLSSTALMFSTPETEPNGRFLGGVPGWSNELDSQIIQNLDIPFTPVFAGNESAQLSVLDEAVQAREPILMYWWTPTAAEVYYNLVKIELPPITEECQFFLERDQGFYDCDYPEDDTVKLASSSLRNATPELYNFFESFTLSNEDQLWMLPQIEFEFRSIESVAEEWVEANREKWEAWLPEKTINKSSGSRQDTFIASLFFAVMLIYCMPNRD